MRKTLIGLMAVLMTAVMLMSLGGAVASDYTPGKVTVPYSTDAPVIDGNITTGEYANAAYIHWSVDGICGLDDGKVSIYAQHDGKNMYVAVDAAYDTSNNLSMWRDWLEVDFNLDHDSHLDYTENNAQPPYDDGGLVVYSGDYYNEVSGSIVIGGMSGFAKTNLSSDKHRIWEFAVSDASLPAPGTYFGIFFWGAAGDCSRLYDQKLPNVQASPDITAYGYPDDGVDDLNAYPASYNVDNFADWTLAVPSTVASVSVNMFPTFMFYFLLGVAVVTGILVLGKYDSLNKKPYNLYCYIIIAISVIGLLYLYLFMGII